MFFFFKQKTAYEMRISDWSSDVCSSDLGHVGHHRAGRRGHLAADHAQCARRGEQGHDAEVPGAVRASQARGLVWRRPCLSRLHQGRYAVGLVDGLLQPDDGRRLSAHARNREDIFMTDYSTAAVDKSGVLRGLVSTARVPPGSEVYNRLLATLYDEAAALDERRFDAWVAMLHEELVYTAPIRLTRTGPTRDRDVVRMMKHFADDYASILLRTGRLSKRAWAEDPPSRCT